MKNFFRNKINQYKKGFTKYLESESIPKEELSIVEKDLSQESIVYILELSAIQVFWTFVVFFIDFFLISRTLIVLIQKKGVYLAILPLVLFHVFNMAAKYFFIKKFAKDRIKISRIELLLGIVPSIGSFLLMGRLLYSKKELLHHMRKYSSSSFKRIFYGLLKKV